MSVPKHVTRKTFLANLRRSRLLDEAQLAAALDTIPTTERGRVIARALVERGLLTRFQAERLLAGRNTGFVLGSYRILDQIGRGGMGRVFKAEHVTMKRLVALKVLAPSLLRSERARELFLREVRAVAQLVHPHIVTAFDASEEAGCSYLVMEYVDGPNLDQLVRKQGPLPVGLACDYIKQAADGLQAAHALGMVHRDIKPGNILVQRRGLLEDSPGLIKISDFGLARLHAPDMSTDAPHHAGTILTRANTVMGTPDFLSPEQARDLHRADIRSDLYSLGCTFYYLLTGQVPFAGGSAVEKLIRHGTELPAALADFRADVPVPVAEIVARLLAKDADERYQTPAELAAALEPYAVSGPTPWAPPPPSNPFLDAVPTPVHEAPRATRSVLDGGSSDDLAAMTNTESPDSSCTPVHIPPVIHRRPIHRRGVRWRRTTTLQWCLGILSALLAALALFMLLKGL
jgi:serine/threonine-protein kinase